MCEQDGVKTAATVVDHVVPHRGDMTLFWDNRNWQSLCQTHHCSTKQSDEYSGNVRGCDVNGQPRDSNHHWA
jgi:5-methylcytosine-specific restriction endonuclease McrA